MKCILMLMNMEHMTCTRCAQKLSKTFAAHWCFMHNFATVLPLNNTTDMQENLITSLQLLSKIKIPKLGNFQHCEYKIYQSPVQLMQIKPRLLMLNNKW